VLGSILRWFGVGGGSPLPHCEEQIIRT